ncbi:hypothetical protein ACLB2K_033949 [Fragaria x ananassa]
MGMWLKFLITVTLVICLTHETLSIELQKPFPLVQANADTAELQLSQEAREVIGNLSFPIAIVSVIGPSGSGKSFFLNELLALSCNEGFQVGNLHDRSRKGVWGVWAEMKIDGAQDIVLFLDTDAADRVGHSEFNDDRIYAIATIMSSVLIYNLPETIHEIDLDRLSFAFEVVQKGPDVPFEPTKLLWLIQREFLEGKSVQEVVHDALLSVPNYNGNKNIDMVNQIRDSLAIMGNNTTAFSLPQPHLERSRLCDMIDNEFDPIYVNKMDQLRHLLASIIRPKTSQGRPIQGKEFVSLLDQILDVSNKVEIPPSGSLLDVFNNVVLKQCVQLYFERMAGLNLPVLQHEIRGRHGISLKEARQCFSQQHLGGNHQETKLLLQLEEETNKMNRYLIMENEWQSSKLCERSYTKCVDKLEKIPLPSLGKINECLHHCEQSFGRECFGPARDHYEQRMLKLLQRSRSLALLKNGEKLESDLHIGYYPCTEVDLNTKIKKVCCTKWKLSASLGDVDSMSIIHVQLDDMSCRKFGVEDGMNIIL